MNAELSGQIVLITGASGGIGLSTARAFANEGASLALHFHTNRAPLDALVPTLNVPSAIVRADARDESQTDAMFVDAIGRLGRIDAIVVNAGVWRPDDVPLHDMTLAQWNETIASDLTSAFLTCRAFLRHLRDVPRQSASIVLIGSTAGLFGEAGHADYAAAKAGLAHGLTLSLKNEIVRLAPRGRVNCVCPGWTDTPMAAPHTANANAVRRATATTSLEKIATPDDVANAIVFLTTDSLAGHISGAILPVAGGMEGRLLRGNV
jgi:3-oxoacyl-[acyl-carrier protein] reductase